VIRDLVGVARSLAGLVLIRAGGWIAGVGGGDTRVSPSEERGDWDSYQEGIIGSGPVKPPVVTEAARELVARREVRVHPREGLAVQVPFRRAGR
jgi:hypothetical protein